MDRKKLYAIDFTWCQGEVGPEPYSNSARLTEREADVLREALESYANLFGQIIHPAVYIPHVGKPWDGLAEAVEDLAVGLTCDGGSGFRRLVAEAAQRLAETPTSEATE